MICCWPARIIYFFIFFIYLCVYVCVCVCMGGEGIWSFLESKYCLLTFIFTVIFIFSYNARFLVCQMAGVAVYFLSVKVLFMQVEGALKKNFMAESFREVSIGFGNSVHLTQWLCLTGPQFQNISKTLFLELFSLCYFSCCIILGVIFLAASF